MRASDARHIVSDLGLDADIEKVVSDAPPLSDEQLDILRHVFRPGMTNAASNHVGKFPTPRGGAANHTDPGDAAPDVCT